MNQDGVYTKDVVLTRPETKASKGILFDASMLGPPLSLTYEKGQAFQVPEGEYTLTVDMENMTLTINGTMYSGIKDINTVNLKSVRFFNLQGMESATLFQGVNIVVGEMTDGSKVITKVVK